MLLKVRTREEAIGWAERYGKILGDGELEIGKVNEPWDIGMAPAPENPPLQMLLIEKADAATEGAGRSPQQKAAISRLKTEMTKAGVLVRSLRLQASAKGKRLVFTRNDLRVIDGPFVESKELIGGFAVMELPGMDETIAMCRRYAEILGGTPLEIDVRATSPASVPAFDAATSARAALLLNERALDDVVPGAVAAALLEAARLEQRDGVGQHRGAAADHHAIVRGVERRQAEVGRQLAARRAGR